MIDARIEGAAARVTLDRPEARNALHQAAMRRLSALLADWAGREDIRELAITGRGRSFCAGASLEDMAAADRSGNPLTAICGAAAAFSAPTVAALNGGLLRLGRSRRGSVRVARAPRFIGA